MIRVAFCGLSGTGKSTLAKFCAETFQCQRVSNFAPLRQATLRVVEEINRRLPPEYRIDVRNKDQMVGPYIQAGVGFREVDPDGLPVTLIHREGLEHDDGVRGYVCDDVRHPNEAEFLKRVGFTIIRLEASEETRRRRVIERDGHLNDVLLSSPSELAVRDVIHDDLWSNEDNEYETNIAKLRALVDLSLAPSEDRDVDE